MIKTFFITALLLLTACQKQSSEQNVVRINIGAEPQTLDPRKARSLNDVNITKLFFEGLMRINADGQSEPLAAESYTIADDGKNFTFKLRRHHWSNGDLVTAHDFVHAWKTTVSPHFPSENAYQLFVIKNAKAIKSGELPSSELGAIAIDDLTLCVELERPIAYFCELLSRPIFFPIHSSGDCSISNGPFKLKEWRHQNIISAEQNHYYWDKKVIKLTGIEMVMVDEATALNLFENGQLDWEGSPFSTLSPESIGYLKEKQLLKTHPFLGTVWIKMNLSRPPLDSKKMRKALAFSIDRQALVSHILHNINSPATAIVPPQLNLQSKPYFTDASTDHALALLDSIKELPPVILTYAAKSRNHKIAQAIQDQWKKTLNLEIKLEPVELQVFFARSAKQDYQLALSDWIADFADPISFLEVFQKKATKTNRNRWNDPAYDKLLEESTSTLDPENRKKMLYKAEKIIMDAMPVIPLYNHAMLYVKNEKLKNVTISSMGSLDFKHAYLEE